jgi:hypothetical protein
VAFLLEGDHDKAAALRDWARPRLMPQIVESAFNQVEPFQRVCGVRPVTEEVGAKNCVWSGLGSPTLCYHAAQEINGKTQVYPEAFRDPSASVIWRLWSLLCHLLAHLGAFLGGEMFHITAFPFLFWNIDKTLGRWVRGRGVGGCTFVFDTPPTPVSLSFSGSSPCMSGRVPKTICDCRVQQYVKSRG